MSIGPWQIILIVALVLIFFGPKRLPGLGKSIGEAIRGFKKGMDEDDAIDVTDSSKNEKINGDPSTTDKGQATEEKAKDKNKA